MGLQSAVNGVTFYSTFFSHIYPFKRLQTLDFHFLMPIKTYLIPILVANIIHLFI